MAHFDTLRVSVPIVLQQPEPAEVQQPEPVEVQQPEPAEGCFYPKLLRRYNYSAISPAIICSIRAFFCSISV